MHRSNFFFVLLTMIAISAAAQDKRRDDLKQPLVLARQGSFFGGGEYKALPAPPQGAGPGAAFGAGDITVNQMYVEYQAPVNAEQHVPVVMVHGCCLSSKTWETTPDGRMGWDEYFVRKGQSVYLADQVSRARSGFDGSLINAVRAGTTPPNQLPNVLTASHQAAWTIFRFGPTFNKPFPDERHMKAAGGDAEMMHLPKLGLRGNSHMLMQDKNNLQVADLILTWITDHVETKKVPRRK